MEASTNVDDSSHEARRICVVGPGAVGGLIAALLWREGHHVTCVARHATAETIAAEGVSVRSDRFGSFTAHPHTAQVLDFPADLCIVAVKSPGLQHVVRLLHGSPSPPAVILPLLNGVEHMDALTAAVGDPGRMLAGTIKVEAHRVDAGIIEHDSPFATLNIAAVRGGIQDWIPAILRGAGFDVVVRADPTSTLWDKLAFLAPFALATASLRASIGPVMADHAEVLTGLVEEVVAVAEEHGSHLTSADVLDMVAALPPTMTSSLHRDVEAGVASELDAIAGAVVRAGAAAGIATPRVAAAIAVLAGMANAR